jgi:hypothetical protein
MTLIDAQYDRRSPVKVLLTRLLLAAPPPGHPVLLSSLDYRVASGFDVHTVLEGISSESTRPPAMLLSPVVIPGCQAETHDYDPDDDPQDDHLTSPMRLRSK